MDSNKYNLKWFNHSDHFQDVISSLFSSGESSDVTLVCDDQVKFKAHQFILKACSPVLKSILEEGNESAKSIVYLRGVNQAELGTVLEFIYLGQATLYQEKIKAFLDVGRDLQIKELMEVPYDENFQNVKVKKSVKENHVKAADPPDFYISTFEDTELLNVDIEFVQSNKISHSNIEMKTSTTRKIDQKVFSDFDSTCPQCGKLFSQRSSMMQHVREIHECLKMFPCNMCEYQATRSSNLKKHKINVHKV